MSTNLAIKLDEDALKSLHQDFGKTLSLSESDRDSATKLMELISKVKVELGIGEVRAAKANDTLQDAKVSLLKQASANQEKANQDNDKIIKDLQELKNLKIASVALTTALSVVSMAIPLVAFFCPAAAAALLAVAATLAAALSSVLMKINMDQTEISKLQKDQGKCTAEAMKEKSTSMSLDSFSQYTNMQIIQTASTKTELEKELLTIIVTKFNKKSK